MTTALSTGSVPAWTLGDRLRKARDSAGFSQQELADLIGISRRSVSSYEGDVSSPARPVVLSWALCTGVPLIWLSDGIVPPADDPEGDGAGRPTGQYTAVVLPLARSEAGLRVASRSVHRGLSARKWAA